MELYESDLSLFGGDLLAGLSSPVDGDADLSGLLQDGYQLDILKPQAPTAGLLADPELSSPESSFQSAPPAVEELFSNQWLDVNTDLLDLLGESKPDEEEPQLVAQSSLATLEAAPPQEGATALQILQSLAEENERELTSPSPPPPPALTSQSDSSSSKPAAGSSVLMDMLLDNGLQDKSNYISLGNCMDVDVDEQLVLEASLAPVLSPVSPEEVETLLSSGPCSPCSASLSPRPSSGLSNDGSEYIPEDDSSADDTWMPSRTVKQTRKRSTPRAAPYTKAPKLSKEAKQEERKLRKKQQNRDAALRYRHKKKQESDHVDVECEKLETRNKELRDKVDQMTREIQYLKDLMADVHRARSILKPKKQ